MSATMRMVVQVVLCFSLVVAFTTSAAAALCLQMEHQGSAMVAGSTVAMGMGSPGPVTSADEVAGAAGMDGTPGSKGSLSASACCHQQVGTPQAVTAPQRALPVEHTVAFPVRVEQFFADTGYPPPGLFDPALEKRDHLTPSLTVLSISRT